MRPWWSTRFSDRCLNGRDQFPGRHLFQQRLYIGQGDVRRHFVVFGEQCSQICCGFISIDVFPKKTSRVIELVHHAVIRRNNDRRIVNLSPGQRGILLPQNGGVIHSGRTSQNAASLRNASSYPEMESTAWPRISRSRRLASDSEEKNSTLGSRARSISMGRSRVTRFSAACTIRKSPLTGALVFEPAARNSPQKGVPYARHSLFSNRSSDISSVKTVPAGDSEATVLFPAPDLPVKTSAFPLRTTVAA